MCNGSSICLFPSVNLVSAETFPMNLYNESLWEYVTGKGEFSSIGSCWHQLPSSIVGFMWHLKLTSPSLGLCTVFMGASGS